LNRIEQDLNDFQDGQDRTGLNRIKQDLIDFQDGQEFFVFERIYFIARMDRSADDC
jgi:hypothetical protein